MTMVGKDKISARRRRRSKSSGRLSCFLYLDMLSSIRLLGTSRAWKHSPLRNTLQSTSFLGGLKYQGPLSPCRCHARRRRQNGRHSFPRKQTPKRSLTSSAVSQLDTASSSAAAANAHMLLLRTALLVLSLPLVLAEQRLTWEDWVSQCFAARSDSSARSDFILSRIDASRARRWTTACPQMSKSWCLR